jgi:hypothetical protein
MLKDSTNLKSGSWMEQAQYVVVQHTIAKLG